MFRRPCHRAYQWRRQGRRWPRLPGNLYRVLALAIFWLTVAPVATYLVSGQAGGGSQSTTPVATSNPSPVPLTATAPQTSNTTATTTQPSGVQGNSPRWAAATVTNNPADVPGSSTVNPQTSDAVLSTTEPTGLAGLVTPRNVTFTAVTTSPQGSMPAISSQSVATGAPTNVKPPMDLPGTNGTHLWYSGQFNVDINADGNPDAVHFVLTVVSSTGAVVALDISSDDANFGETAGGSLTNGVTGANDDERTTVSGSSVRLGPFYTFVVVFAADGSSAQITASTWYTTTVAGADLDGDGSADDTFYAAISDTDSDGIYDRLDLSIGDNVFGEGNLSDGVVDYSAADNTNDERLSAAANVKMGVNTFRLTFDATPGGAGALAVTTVGSVGNQFAPRYNAGDGNFWTMTTIGSDAVGKITPTGAFTLVDGYVGGGGGANPNTMAVLPGLGPKGTIALYDCNYGGTWFIYDAATHSKSGMAGTPNGPCDTSVEGVSANANGTRIYHKVYTTIWEIDPTTGNSTLVLTNALLGRVFELDWDASTGTLLGHGQDPATNNHLLYRINLSLGTVTQIPVASLNIWSYVVPDPVTGMVYLSTADTVHQLDPGTGQLTSEALPAGSFIYFTDFGPARSGIGKSLYGLSGTNPYYVVEIAGSFPLGTSGATAMTSSATWWTATLTLDANVDGDVVDTVDTLYFVLTDLDSDGVYDRLDLSLANDTFAQGGNLENALVSTASDDERLLTSQGLARDVTLGSQLFVVSFVRNPGGVSVTSDVTIQAKTWYKGTFSIDVDANGTANDTVSFVLSDTDSDGLYDAMDLSTNDTDYEDGVHTNQQTGATDDETIASGEDVRLGDYYTFTIAFVNNPGAGGSVASITSRTWFTGSFTIDSDGGEVANDAAYLAVSDTDSDGLYDTLDLSTDDDAFGEGTLSGQVPLQTGANDDERLGIGTGGSAEVRLGSHNFTVSFDNNPAAPARSDDARLMARWYVGTLDGLPFVQVSPTSNGLYTVLEFDANASNSYEASEVHLSSPANISIGGSQSTLAYSSNPTISSSVTLSGSSAGAQVAPPSSDQAGSFTSATNPPASQVLAQEAEKAQKEADAQDGPESKQPIPPQAAEPPPARITRDINSQPLAGDEVVVSLSPDLPDPERRIRQIAFATGATIVGSVAATGTYQLQFQVADLTALEKIISRVEGFTGVASASHHYLLDDLARTPNDSKYPSWGEGGGDSWDMRMMRLPEAWETTTGQASVRVAVLDADFDRNHEDLRDNVASISAPKRTKAGGHGTHVSGTICARGNNAVGVAGVVWDCSLSLYDFGGASPVKAQEAMIAAVQSGARIINMSLQWVDNNQCGTVGTSATSKKVEEVNNILKGALDYARRERRDVLWVFAAGNECRDSRYASPASLVRKYPDNVIVVGSVGPAGDMSYFSNYGDMVTVVAPGEDILSTLPQNDYGLLSGTSMATPHVSGLAALIMSQRPTLSATQVKQCIVGTAQPSSPNHRYKLVNAAEAVMCGETAQPPTPQRVYGGG